MLGIRNQYNSVAVPEPLQRIGGGTTVTDAHPRALYAHNRAMEADSGALEGQDLFQTENRIRIWIRSKMKE